MNISKPFSVTVESGIPIPPQPRKSGKLGPVKVTLLGMKPGDSFTVPDERAANRVRTNAVDLGIVLAVRRQPADSTHPQEYYRIWHNGVRPAKKGGK